MKITFLGTGTSQGIPVICCNCEVCRSDDPKDNRLRVSVLVETGDKTIVIDSGPDFRYQMLRAGVKDLDAIVYTHEHKDHVAGLDDIRPFNYLLQKNIDLYATVRVQEALKREFSYIFAEKVYPGIPQVNMHTIGTESFFIGETELIPLEIMHYKLPILGFRMKDFTYITDAKTIPQHSIDLIKGTKVLVINALQVEPHISHFTLAEAVEFAQEIGAEMTYFTHISHNMGKHADVEKELPANIRLAYDGLVINL
ncbi:MBL fold metallo-hydrolase [Pedobacter cryoconitis]|uniref:Phosphoribosyl 1,2-cyclic phosphate phosphodiesterase n=1 Tax=Pedobacter cryoconitis TaxID=188932 RepID=A0A7X0J1P2_9SPHI|nr:MBL fold metallo-hydrolase [Pedobacter cryoconitis]MBB6498177.1 phosphoribosyl 1,2-cyclic phosphate phosphodiesterase [Pedobacter cryoconitis]